MSNPFYDICFEGIIEERYIGKCANCNNTTIYFCNTLNCYICSVDCGEEIEIYGLGRENNE